MYGEHITLWSPATRADYARDMTQEASEQSYSNMSLVTGPLPTSLDDGWVAYIGDDSLLATRSSLALLAAQAEGTDSFITFPVDLPPHRQGGEVSHGFFCHAHALKRLGAEKAKDVAASNSSTPVAFAADAPAVQHPLKLVRGMGADLKLHLVILTTLRRPRWTERLLAKVLADTYRPLVASVAVLARPDQELPGVVENVRIKVHRVHTGDGLRTATRLAAARGKALIMSDRVVPDLVRHTSICHAVPAC